MLDPSALDRLTPEEIAEAIELHDFIERHDNQRKFYSLFPDADTLQPDGTLIHARSKYAKHLEFFDAGRQYRERAAICANRIGKTFGMGGYETACHLTGIYPDWWTGRRFTMPTRIWACGKTNETTRDIVQATMLGEVAFEGGRKGFAGTGLVPGALIGGCSWKAGVADLADVVKVKHVSGRYSSLGFKSYQQGRSSFEGTAQHAIWLDEEPPLDVYGECLIRTATTKGIIYMTFTPLAGISETVMQFLTPDQRPDNQEAD
jgi:phage terminase large subunit-like protein